MTQTTKLDHLKIQINEDDFFKFLDWKPTWMDNPERDFPWMAPQVVNEFADAINAQIHRKYDYYCIGVHPYERFEERLEMRIIEGVQRQQPVLQQIFHNHGIDITAGNINGLKEGTVNSDYPQSALNPADESYAKDASNHWSHGQVTEPQLQMYRDFNDPNSPYQDPIAEIVNGVDSCFSHLVY